MHSRSSLLSEEDKYKYHIVFYLHAAFKSNMACGKLEAKKLALIRSVVLTLSSQIQLLLRHSRPQLPSNSRGIACWMAELNAG